MVATTVKRAEMPKSAFVWYPCRHSHPDGLYWSNRSMQETGTLMHKEGSRKNVLRCCPKCVKVSKSGKRRNRKEA
jgi:hypothetical protein